MIDASTAARSLRTLLNAVEQGESFTITRYGQPVASLGPVRMEHLATDPAHRPVPETLTVTNSTDGQKITFPDRVLGGATFTRADIEPMEGQPVKTYAQRQPQQAARDDLLTKMNRGKK